ncbi:unnamed protein product, partial [Musa textilis]
MKLILLLFGSLRPPYVLLRLERENLQHSDMHFSKLSSAISARGSHRSACCCFVNLLRSSKVKTERANIVIWREMDQSQPKFCGYFLLVFCLVQLGFRNLERYLACSGGHGPRLENRMLGRRFPAHHCHRSISYPPQFLRWRSRR